MAEVSEKQLLKAVKAGNGHAATAEQLGITPGQLPMLTFCRAQVEAGHYKTAPATAKSVKDLRNKENNRWELIAARTGLSMAKVKELYGGEEAARKSYTGRGRNFANGDAPKKKGGNKSAANSGRKNAATGSKTKPVAKARTRKERQARAGNPS